MTRQKAIVLVGLVAAVAAAFFMFEFGNTLEKRVPVVVVTRPVMPYEIISSRTNVSIKRIPPRYVLPNAATLLSEVEGKTAKIQLYEHEQIILDKLNPKKIAPLPGEKYLQIPLKGITIKPGECVDIWLEYIPGKSRYTGVEKILSQKMVASSLDSQGKNLYDPVTGTINQGMSVQASIEILATDEEIKMYIERSSAANQVIVRNSSN